MDTPDTPASLSGTGPSDVLLKYPWWKCIFRWYDRPQYIETGSIVIDGVARDAAVYRQMHRRTGRYRYWVTTRTGREAIDPGAYENCGKMVFIGNMDYAT